MSDDPSAWTPRRIVAELDRYIVGQQRAKRAVAIALRNRWRRQHCPPDIRDEIAPKNILLIGPTGVGKTEIARRLARLVRAPFTKVEASKFTEVGYVGRDVESMVRDLVEAARELVRAEHTERVRARAAELAEQRLVSAIVATRNGAVATRGDEGPADVPAAVIVTPPPGRATGGSPAEVLQALRDGRLEDEEVEIEVRQSGNPFWRVFGAHGVEEMEIKVNELFGALSGRAGRPRRRRLRVRDARRVLEAEEADRLVDPETVQREAVERTEQTGILFIDEIDKIAGRQSPHGGPDVSREGVQRDLLPIVEGSTVQTKYGPVRTDHVLFIAAGAFHVSRPSDLIPELQGRFPIRVELEPLGAADFVRILTEPRHSLVRQYTALLATEQVELRFTPGAIEAMARHAAEANARTENIGARRLHTVLEAVLDEVSFDAPQRAGQTVVIDEAHVQRVLGPVVADSDLARYVL
ncbi:MAG: ATP-dependent protease ATPase subunit HslU [Myxococcota bacterium]|nr:ATP-dependent protease ATPase subunit HslU [Myxococcota bacterium]MDW8363051.1 ATP-dependent protease ATPase subunit HslU [Myxococcales bacterium]